MRAAAQRWIFRPHPSKAARWVARGVQAYTAGRVARSTPSGGARVVLVGGPAIGGAGRTAVVEALARRALEAGRAVAIVGHGYRGSARGPCLVDAPDAARFGDEAVALWHTLPGAAHWIGPRAALVSRLRAGAHLVLVDGGLLDPLVRPTAVVAVLDATAPRGVLPAGPNRVDPDSLGVDLRWLHRVDEAGARPWRGAAVRSRVVPRHVVLPGGAVVPPTWLRGRRVVPICGVARPSSFHHTLDALGAERAPGLVCGDHHRFQPDDARGLPTGLPWVTTRKDAARVPASWPVAVLDIDLAIEADAPDALGEMLGIPWA